MNFTEQRMEAVYLAATQLDRILSQLDSSTPGYASLEAAFEALERAIVEYEDSTC
jgi:hypothetical protein